MSVCLHLNLLSQIFSVMDDVCFSAEILIGYHTMSHFNISLFPFIHQIAQNGIIISASPFPESLPSPDVYIVTHTPSQDSSHVPLSSLETPSVAPDPVLSSTPADSPSEALHSDSDNPSSPTTLSDVLSNTRLRKAVLTSVVVTQTDLCLVRVVVKGVSPGTDILSLSDSARLNGVALESVLSTLYRHSKSHESPYIPSIWHDFR